jgi:autophagy-related protein 9
MLQAMSWDDVVQRLIQLHENKIFRVAVKEKLSEHDIVARILRKENYLVALINKVEIVFDIPNIYSEYS